VVILRLLATLGAPERKRAVTVFVTGRQKIVQTVLSIVPAAEHVLAECVSVFQYVARRWACARSRSCADAQPVVVAQAMKTTAARAVHLLLLAQ